VGRIFPGLSPTRFSKLCPRHQGPRLPHRRLSGVTAFPMVLFLVGRVRFLFFWSPLFRLFLLAHIAPPPSDRFLTHPPPRAAPFLAMPSPFPFFSGILQLVLHGVETFQARSLFSSRGLMPLLSRPPGPFSRCSRPIWSVFSAPPKLPTLIGRHVVLPRECK